MSLNIGSLTSGSFATESLAKFALSGPQAAANTQIAMTGSPANAKFLSDLSLQMAPAQGQVAGALQLVNSYNVRKQQEALLQQQALLAQLSTLTGAAGGLGGAGAAIAPLLGQLTAALGAQGGGLGAPTLGATGLGAPALGVPATGGIATQSLQQPSGGGVSQQMVLQLQQMLRQLQALMSTMA